ncbi:MAG: glycosyltransferase family 4 protein [Petrimonas sp.]|uniref:glycosyltransferase family 4 protein n=1 Tax=Petrimonas sp. TaxID=2023866 RepID=UPI002A2FAA3C|nr:glycosyltransferase family 4 protein [Parabacteroides sp.]MEA4997189.1 glycosyltransferase family 4 protein [Petrimonas sp.]MEA5044894.1 glycosyltransferase family 4 protein [Petrimonas sp.]
MIDVIIVDLVSNYFTGIERYSEVLKSKSRHNIRVHHLIFQTYKCLPKVIVKDDCFTALLYLPKHIVNVKRYKPLYFDLIVHLLSPCISSMQNIVWHLNHLNLPGIVQILQDRLGGKYLLAFHCLPWKYSISRNFERYTKLELLYRNKQFDDFRKEENSGFDYNKPDKIICMSESARCFLEKIHKVDPFKITKIYNGIDIETFQMKRDELTILYSGRITKDKGVLDLLDAVDEIVRSTDYYPKIKFAGYCHIPKHKILSEYSNLNIEFINQVDLESLKKVYATATFGVVPSLHEQCSYTAIEMAAFGLPMIVSDVDALSEMFEDHKTVLFNKLVFNPGVGLYADKKLFVKNIIEMIENKELRNKMGNNLRRLFKEKFTGVMCEFTYNVYESLFNDNYNK